jgi:hypothetical protein
MRIWKLVSTLAIVALALSAVPAGAQKEGSTAAKDAPAAMQPVKPGPEHARLAKHVGKWKVSQKSMWDPSQPAKTCEGTEECTLVADGLFLRSDYHVNDATGDFHGFGLVGYDTTKKKYVGNWVDNYSTMITPYEGTCEGNKCTFTMVMPGEGGKTTTATMISEDVDANHRKFTMLVPGPDGKPVTMMETMYTRM